MRSSNQVPTSVQDFSLHKEEKETLYYAAGYIVRRFLLKGKQQHVNPRSTAKKKCDEDQFVFVEGDSYSNEFLDLKKWYDCLDKGGLVPVNEALFNFIVDLEIIICKCMTGNELKHEWVTNELLLLLW